jgi:hypothetical protein
VRAGRIALADHDRLTDRRAADTARLSGSGSPRRSRVRNRGRRGSECLYGRIPTSWADRRRTPWSEELGQTTADLL